jgi:DNA-binding NarL/FixJ family response regulator
VIRVVIADDHPLVRSGLTGLLTGEDDVEIVATAGNGDEVVAAAAEHHPDVVLMDLSMPGTGGIEATRRIAASSSNAKVVVLTAFSDRERILAALEAGAIGYLLKDAEPEEVVRAVRTAARGDAPLDPRAARELLIRDRSATAGAERLSAREREVLMCVREGLANKRIAQRLEISERTVKAHLTRIYEALGVSDRTAAALWARDHGF